MASFIDAQGQTQQLNLDVTLYRHAADNGMSLQQYMNVNFPTNAEKYGTTFNQLMASEGIFVKGNQELAIRPSTMKSILEGTPKVEAGVTTKDATPASRILFPAVFMQAIESKLMGNLEMTANAFEQMIGVDEAINGDRFEQPIINYSGPEAGRSQGIAQLASPASMLTITASDVSKRIPTFSLGLEISDQALQATTLDLVALSVARQAAVERNARVNDYLLALLNGDTDAGQSALPQVQAKSFDSTLTVLGTLSQKAWAKWLFTNSTKRNISHIVCDIDTALTIEGRSGRPVVTNDNGASPRINTWETVMNPIWPTAVNMFIVDTTSSWTANTIMGLDKQYAIRRVRNLNASYTSIEQFVTRRSSVMRLDFAEIVTRLYDDAFSVVNLTVA